MTKEFLCIVDSAVTGGLGTDERSAVAHAFTRKYAVFVCVTDALVLAEKEADFAAADTDVARGYVDIRSDVALKLGHKGLAETHNLGVRLALRVKVRTALAAAHRKTCEGVFENLLKAEEPDD